MKTLISFIKLLRMEQWVKNSFVLAGVVFAGKMMDASCLVLSVKAFFVFCIASSSVYAFNDCVDYQLDKKHQIKKRRPIASGALNVYQGLLASAMLSVTALLLAFVLVNDILVLIIVVYIITNILYSKYLKSIVLIDVFIIAFGFMLRVIAGTYALGIPPSHWIIICTMMISLFLGFCKRYAELKNNNIDNNQGYSKDFLLVLIGVSSACTIITYGLYTINENTILMHGSKNLVYSIPMVMYGLFRYMHLVISDEKGGSPSKEIFADIHIVFSIVFYLVFIFVVRV